MFPGNRTVIGTSDVLAATDALTKLDPATSFPERGASAIARLARAKAHRLCNDEVTENADRNGGLAISLRVGRDCFGTLVLESDEGAELSASDVRVVRWAARLFAKQLHLAKRLNAPRNGRAPDLARTSLTPRERDVVQMILAGASTRKIAGETGLTISTVHTYLKRIYPKLGVHSRVEMVAKVAGRA